MDQGATRRVLVAGLILAPDDHRFVDGWAAAARSAIADERTVPEEQTPGGRSGADLCVALRADDSTGQAACAAAGVRVLQVPTFVSEDTDGDLPGLRAAVGRALLRTRLLREAVEQECATILYLDVDVRLTPVVWAAQRRLLEGGAAAAVIPYSLSWAPAAGIGAPAGSFAGGPAPLLALRLEEPQGARLVLADARCLRTDPPGAAVSVVLAGFGCTALATELTARIPFTVAEVPIPEGRGNVLGEDVGWFLAAAREGVSVRTQAGVIATRLWELRGDGAPAGPCGAN